MTPRRMAGPRRRRRSPTWSNGSRCAPTWTRWPKTTTSVALMTIHSAKGSSIRGVRRRPRGGQRFPHANSIRMTQTVWRRNASPMSPSHAPRSCSISPMRSRAPCSVSHRATRAHVSSARCLPRTSSSLTGIGSLGACSARATKRGDRRASPERARPIAERVYGGVGRCGATSHVAEKTPQFDTDRANGFWSAIASITRRSVAARCRRGGWRRSSSPSTVDDQALPGFAPIVKLGG